MKPRLKPDATREERVAFLRRHASEKTRRGLVKSGAYTEQELFWQCVDCATHMIRLVTTRIPKTDQTERLVRCGVCGLARTIAGPRVGIKPDNTGRSYWPMYWAKDESKERIVPEEELLQRAIDSGTLSPAVEIEVLKLLNAILQSKR